CETRALYAAAEHVARERDGVDDRRRDSPARHPLELTVDEADVEGRIVCDEHRVTGELAEAPQGRADARCSAQLSLCQPGQAPDLRGEGDAGCDERLDPVDCPQSFDPDGADLADAR